MELIVKQRCERQIHAIWGPVLIRIADGAPTDVADIDRLHCYFVEMLERWPTIGMLLVAHHENPMPSVAALRHAKQQMPALADRIVIAVALLGLGFWADAGRSMVGMFMRMAGGGTFVLEKSVDAAATKLGHELIGLDPAGLIDACAQLERQFRAR
jgi:hypothetical protein